jgi:glutamate/tyrosine decarboxylase-like PLP-dependent enzyme
MEAGFIPYLYVAILGSTGTCAFDDLMELGPVVQEYGMWMHVDAAYGGSCFACPEMRYLMKGMEYAWSLNTNANKWMLCNFDLSFLWVRYRRKLVGCLTGYKEEIWETPEFPIVNLKVCYYHSRMRIIKMPTLVLIQFLTSLISTMLSQLREDSEPSSSGLS